MQATLLLGFRGITIQSLTLRIIWAIIVYQWRGFVVRIFGRQSNGRALHRRTPSDPSFGHPKILETNNEIIPDCLNGGG